MNLKDILIGWIAIVAFVFVVMVVLLGINILDGHLTIIEYLQLVCWPVPVFSTCFGTLAYLGLSIANFLDRKSLENRIRKEKARLQPQWEIARKQEQKEREKMEEKFNRIIHQS